jgi:hypothetical protein
VSYQTIGATTLDEYRKHLEKDAALERRFQPIQVAELHQLPTQSRYLKVCAIATSHTTRFLSADGALLLLQHLLIDIFQIASIAR